MEGRPTRLPPRDATPADIDLSDIQGNVLRGYTMPAAAYLMLRISDVAQATALLRRSLPLVSTAETWDRQPAAAINLSFSFAGLQQLGLDPDTLASFPPAFREGMRARATLLGDVGPSDPDHWEFDEPHVLVSVFAADAARLEETLGSVLVPDTQDGVELLHVQRAHELPGGKDHFGFFDGVSQPAIQGSGVLSRPGDGIRHGERGWREVATGEVLLGYPDEDGTLPKAPHAPYDRNGTYVVLRKLAVDSAAFRRFVAEAGYPGGPGCWPPRSSGAGRTAPRSPWRRTARTRHWRATRRGSTTSATRTTRRACAVRWGRTSVAPTRATLRASSADGSAPGTASSAAAARTATPSRPA